MLILNNVPSITDRLIILNISEIVESFRGTNYVRSKFKKIEIQKNLNSSIQSR